jgi:hypothetical protein
VALFALLVLGAAGGIVYVVDQVRETMSTRQDQNPPVPPTQPSQPIADSRPAPRFPPNRLIREGFSPRDKPEGTTTSPKADG